MGGLPAFDRRAFAAGQRMSRLGPGEPGGKAAGLAALEERLAARFPAPFRGITVEIPRFVVLATGIHEAFLERNDLGAFLDAAPTDDRIAHAFQEADLPEEILGDLRALAEGFKGPLAVRSSSRLEDALHHPFAGIYQTKMIPHNQPDPGLRFQKLAEAVKFVLASAHMAGARAYVKAVGRAPDEERMGVLIQEVVGLPHGERFYPNLAGVARTVNVYPHGNAAREDGVAALALGLGKTIVDGGRSWIVSPAFPKAPPPFVSPRDLLRISQIDFWAVNLGAPPAFDPVAETEYLVRADLAAAEYDGTLDHVASTYDPEGDRLFPGTGREGPRVVTFAPLLELETFPLNDLVRELLAAGEEMSGGPVEIEFALTLPQRSLPDPPRLGFLQVRPMLVATTPVAVDDADLARPDLLLSTDQVMGNGRDASIRDVVYVKPSEFTPRESPAVAGELEAVNRALAEAERPYLLIGFGRWGSTDPWLGIPVRWDQISGARVIVEGSLEGFTVDASQGAHLFQNLLSFQVFYFWLSRPRTDALDWGWLDGLPAERETRFVRHVRLPAPLRVLADGRTGRGGIWRG